MSRSEIDSQYMRRALALAEQGRGYVEPNPLVGCVLVNFSTGSREMPTDVGQTIGEGYHTGFGRPHAEREAIADARRRGNAEQLAGCTAYVTLEPCCHFGKTPPCTDALLEIGVARVVVAMLDPFPEVAGHGVDRLQRSGVEVAVGVAEEQAKTLNAPYLKSLALRRPWVIAKWAMSLDGKIASHTGHSQWISGPASRAKVQRLRGQVDAIIVGIGAAVADDPMLNARTPDPPPRTALRVIVDSTLRLPLGSRLVQTADDYPTLVWTGPQANVEARDALESAGCQVVASDHRDATERLADLLKYLHERRQATNVMAEGGGRLLGSLLTLHQIDQCEVFIAPKLIGGDAAKSPLGGMGFFTVNEGPRAVHLTSEHLEDDLHISCHFQWQNGQS